MVRYGTERDAKEYLVGRIVAEAEREEAPLTEIERKMLYFTETGWTLPNMLEVNAEFERDYDNDEYEQKIAGLAREVKNRNKVDGGEQKEAWNKAAEKLLEGDHYLSVLIDSKLVTPAKTGRPPGDFLRLVLTAIAIVAVAMAVMVLINR